MMRRAHDRVLVANIEAAKPLGKMPRQVGNRGMTPTPIRICQGVEQRWRRAGKRNLEVQRECVVVDSSHGDDENKMRTYGQEPAASPWPGRYRVVGEARFPALLGP